MIGRFASLTRHLLGRENLSGGAATDRQLLEQFIRNQDQAAFAAILERHGPMVRSVCRRVLGRSADADDAFQATFLVLVRKASAVDWRESIGGWLYAVAYRVARKARSSAARADDPARLAAPQEAPAVPDVDPLAAATHRELCAVLDEELARLPEKYRLPLVLCYLEGRTNEEAARQLGWTKGTVSGRLARARDRMRGQLARRGFALSVAALDVALCETGAADTLPVAIFESTLEAAALAASGSAAVAGVVSARAVALSEGVSRAMSLTRLKVAAVAVAALCLFGTGATLVAYRGLAADTRAAARSEPPSKAAEKAAPTPTNKGAGPKPTTDKEKLQGTWHVASGEFQGKPLTREELEQFHEKLIIREDEFVLVHGDFEVVSNLKTDPTKKPRTFDLFTRTNVIDRGVKRVEEARTGLGIYELDGETLKVATAGEGGGRPTGFTTTADTNYSVLTYKRGEPPAKPDAQKQPEFVEAEVTLHQGGELGEPYDPKKDLKKAVKDKATLAKFLACFPEAGRGKKSKIAGGWVPRITVKFTGGKGESVTVVSTWTNWSEGQGDWLVKANLMKHAGELFEERRLTDQGSFMDDWKLETFEEGGKKVVAKNAGFDATPSTWSLTVDDKVEWEAQYTIDPDQKPRQIDLVFESDTKAQTTYQGIYTIEGDALKVCLDKSGTKRPTEFKTTPGNANEVLLTLRRK